MAKYYSYEHARNNITLLWEQSGFDIAGKPLGVSVGQELGEHVYQTRLGALYAFVDEFLGILRYVTHYFLSGIPTASGHRSVMFYRLSVSQLRNVTAIRALCALGLDGNARMQLRLLYETSLFWTRVQVDAPLAREFEAAVLPKAANEFWHRHLAREKNEKWLRRYFAETSTNWIGSGAIAEELKEKLSLSAHPSFLQSYFAGQDDFRDAADSMVLCTPSDSSHFTLCMTLFAATVPFSVFPEPPYGLQTVNLMARSPWHPKHKATQDWEEYNAHLRRMIPTLMIASVRFGEELGKRLDDVPGLGTESC